MSAERLARCTVYAILLWSPLAIGANRPWPLAALELLTVLGVLFWTLHMVRQRRLEWRRSVVDLPLTLLVLLVVLQLALGNRPLVAWALGPAPPALEVSAPLPTVFLTAGTIVPSHTVRSLIVFLTYIGAYVLVLHLIRTRQQLDRLVTTLVSFGGVLAFVALLDYLAGEAQLLRWRDIPLGGRLAGTFGNPDHFAAWLNMVICLGLGALAARRASAPAPLRAILGSRELREDAVRRYLPFIGLVVMLVALVFTLSRGGLLSLAVTFVVLLILLLQLGRIRWSLAVIGALIVVALAYAAWIGLDPLLHRVRHADYANRWVLATSTLPMLRTFPILGVGLGAYGEVYPRYQPPALLPGRLDAQYAHNDLLQLVVELGIVGAVLAALMLWSLGRDLVGAHLLGSARCAVGGGEDEGAQRHDPFSVGLAVGAIGAILGLLIHSAYDFSAHIPANGVLAAACLGIATVALHTRFNVGRTRFLTLLRLRSVDSRRTVVALGSMAVVVALVLAALIVRTPIAAGLVRDTDRPGTDRSAALRRLDLAVTLDPIDQRAREARGRLRLGAALETWHVGATSDQRVLTSWDERRTAAVPLVQAAIGDYERAIASAPLNPFLHESLARAHATLAMLDTAGAREHLATAVAHFSRAVAAVPESPSSYRSLAVFAVPLGKEFTEVGLRAARGAVARDPAVLPGLVERFTFLPLTASQWVAAVPESATDRIELGTLLEKHRLLSEALTVYRAAVEVATPSERAVARWLLARALVQQGLRREAAAELQLALSQDPSNPELHLQRARVLAVLGDAGARDAYQLAALNADVLARRSREERDVFGALPSRLRGIVAAVVGPQGNAMEQYRQAYAQYLTDNRLWEQALREWQVIVGDAPKNATAHFGRGVALEALGARERAVEAYREAVTLDSSNIARRLRFAQALWQTDQYYQAINEWRTVLGRAPGHVDARLALARAYVRTGNQSEASREYQTLLLIAPERPEARQELARLRAAR